jgi:prefoldin subunit 5
MFKNKTSNVTKNASLLVSVGSGIYAELENIEQSIAIF